MSDHPDVPAAVVDAAMLAVLRSELGRAYPHPLDDLRTDVSEVAAVVLEAWLAHWAEASRRRVLVIPEQRPGEHGAPLEAVLRDAGRTTHVS